MSGWRFRTNSHTAWQWFHVGFYVGLGLTTGGMLALSLVAIVARIIRWASGGFT